jgi:hypothetical protein
MLPVIARARINILIVHCSQNESVFSSVAGTELCVHKVCPKTAIPVDTSSL